MSYSSPSDVCARYDARTLGQLCEDSGTQLSPSQILADKNIQIALDDATAEVNTAIQQGNRYTADDINNLLIEGTPGYNALQRLCCDIAYTYLVMRRGYGSKEMSSMPQRV